MIMCTNHKYRPAVKGTRCCPTCIQWRNERRAKYRALGTCPACGKASAPGLKVCEECRGRSKKNFDKRRAVGLCGCGNPRAEGRKKCAECLATANRRAASFRSMGLCYCGKHKPKEGYTLCPVCLDKRNARNKSLRSAGICVCGRPSCGEFSFCLRCRRKASERFKGMREDKAFAFLIRIRDCIYKSVKKRRKYRKAGRSEYILGCTYDFAQKHIESQFLSNMGWHNMELWHIDHYIPCSFFNLADERHQRLCNNWRNLRPMWAADNLSKKNKLPRDYKARLAELELHVPHLDPMNDPMF